MRMGVLGLALGGAELGLKLLEKLLAHRVARHLAPPLRRGVLSNVAPGADAQLMRHPVSRPATRGSGTT
jgi:hypothetical protein